MDIKILIDAMREKKVPDKVIERYHETLTFIAGIVDGIGGVEMWSILKDSVLPFRIIAGGFDFKFRSEWFSAEIAIDLKNPSNEYLMEFKKVIDQGKS